MKNVLITGANKRIGFETAKQLAQLNYFFYLGGRNRACGLEAIQKLHLKALYKPESSDAVSLIW
jgi:NAD(P)-dependent dehydrogenase (short-subunit alcohol dehydrogenase family)